MGIFLSIDEDKPLGICLGEEGEFEIVPLNEFFKESLIGMSEKHAAKYANEFERFALKLRLQQNDTVTKSVTN